MNIWSIIAGFLSFSGHWVSEKQVMCVKHLWSPLYRTGFNKYHYMELFLYIKSSCSRFFFPSIFPIHVQYARFVCVSIILCHVYYMKSLISSFFFLNLFIELNLNLMFVLIKCYIWQRCMLCKSSLCFTFK